MIPELSNYQYYLNPFGTIYEYIYMLYLELPSTVLADEVNNVLLFCMLLFPVIEYRSTQFLSA